MSFNSKRNPKSIKSIIEDTAEHSAISSIALSKLVGDAWRLTVGDYIASNTKIAQINNGVLRIHAESSTIRSEIIMRQNSIITNINNKLGKNIIKEITFF